MAEKKKHPGGRPSPYKSEYAHIAYEVCKASGAINPKLAKIFKVTPSTISLWMKKYPEFSGAIKAGKDEFNLATAENCLFKRLRGYRYKETTKENVVNPITKELELTVTKVVTKEVPPSDTALIFFLKNRDPERWRDKQNVEHTITLDMIRRIFDALPNEIQGQLKEQFKEMLPPARLKLVGSNKDDNGDG